MINAELEKKAEEYAIESGYIKGRPDFWIIVQAYIAGHKQAVKENGIVWHDLRKNPNDLPQKVGDYLVALDYKTETFSTFLLKYDIDEYDIDETEDYTKFGWFDSEYTRYDNDVIAWCELPKLEVEE